jgi:hypothetical protein
VAQRTNEKRVKLGELERDLNASRSLYESFLTRFKTTAQDESFPISEARVVTEAAPARFPSHPKSLLVLALAGGAGVLLGVGLGLMRERLDDVIRSGEDLEAVTGTEMLGVVPSFGDDITRQKISRHTLANVRKLTPVQQTERLLPHDLGYLRYAVDYPFSRTAETMRSVKLALQFAAAPADDCVVGIVSALPNEGKSSVAANLAHHLASTGSRTLLIDCDLRNPSITRQIAGRTPGGLPDILYRNGSLESLVFVDPVTGMHFLSAGTRSAIHQTTSSWGRTGCASSCRCSRRATTTWCSTCPRSCRPWTRAPSRRWSTPSCTWSSGARPPRGGAPGAPLLGPDHVAARGQRAEQGAARLAAPLRQLRGPHLRPGLRRDPVAQEGPGRLMGDPRIRGRGRC